jgi:hypothetical protein
MTPIINSELLEKVLLKNDYQPISKEQLAKVVGFNEKEFKILDVFWESAYSDDWIRLPRTLIKKWFLLQNIQKSAITKFYYGVLFKYKEGKDYRHISDAEYKKILVKTGKGGGHNVKIYEVTKKCFKLITYDRNKELLNHYMKIEELVVLYKLYHQKAEEHSNTYSLLSTITCDEPIKQALIKYNYIEINETQLAETIGFTDNEKNMLNIFWDSAFNKGWIYLSPKLIKDDMGYTKLNNFYSNTLYKQYKEGVDYKEVDATDVVVKLYENSKCLSISTYKIPHKRGSTQKYYLVSGRTFKKMLMRCKTSASDKICEYYLKVEELAIFMRDYIQALHQILFQKQLDESKKQLDESKQLIQEQKKKFEEQKIVNCRIQTHINNIKPLEKNTTLYIATSKKYAQENIFKVGCVDSINKKKLRSRLSSYNTGKLGNSNDTFYFCYILECYTSSELDHKLKKILSFCKSNKNKEMCVLHYEALIKFVNFIAENHDKEYSFFNKFIKDDYAGYINKIPIIPPSIDIGNGIKLTITETNDDNELVRIQLIDTSNMTLEQRNEKIKDVMNQYIREQINDQTYDCSKDSLDSDIIVLWKEIQHRIINVLGKTPKWKLWKDATRNLNSTINNVSIKYR